VSFPFEKCDDCNGTGHVGESHYMGEFQPPERERCESCGGSGFVRAAAPQPPEPVRLLGEKEAFEEWWATSPQDSRSSNMREAAWRAWQARAAVGSDEGAKPFGWVRTGFQFSAVYPMFVRADSNEIGIGVKHAIDNGDYTAVYLHPDPLRAEARAEPMVSIPKSEMDAAERGEMPEWESPLMTVHQHGAEFAVTQLAEMMGVKDWDCDGGSESYEGDLQHSISSLLQHAAGCPGEDIKIVPAEAWKEARAVAAELRKYVAKRNVTSNIVLSVPAAQRLADRLDAAAGEKS
jgi:hypothetical protein